MSYELLPVQVIALPPQRGTEGKSLPLEKQTLLHSPHPWPCEQTDLPEL